MGGGEPTLNPYFEEAVDWISLHVYRQRINTNGIIYSYATEKAIAKGKASLRLSIDAGTYECFNRVKGHIKYQEVWDNIEKYRKSSAEVYIKYNICNYNSDLYEIDAFLKNVWKLE